MKTKNGLLVILPVLWLVGAGCWKSENQIVNSPSATNLLTNASFEIGQVASLEGWNVNNTDTSFINLSTDTPKGGGLFSARLRNEWDFAGALWQTTLPSSGTHRYLLNASGKVVPSGPIASGWMKIEIKHAGVWSISKSVQFSDTIWTSISILDTLTADSGDSIAVKLSGDFHQWSFGHALFDLVKLERLD